MQRTGERTEGVDTIFDEHILLHGRLSGEDVFLASGREPKQIPATENNIENYR